MSEGLGPGPCYGVVKKVYRNGRVCVVVYPDSSTLSDFLFLPGSPVELVANQGEWCFHDVGGQDSTDSQREGERVDDCGSLHPGKSCKPGSLVRYDPSLKTPRYIVMGARLLPGQLRTTQNKLIGLCSEKERERYSDLVAQKFVTSGLSKTAERELARLERKMDRLRSLADPVINVIDEVERMLLTYQFSSNHEGN